MLAKLKRRGREARRGAGERWDAQGRWWQVVAQREKEGAVGGEEEGVRGWAEAGAGRAAGEQAEDGGAGGQGWLRYRPRDADRDGGKGGRAGGSWRRCRAGGPEMDRLRSDGRRDRRGWPMGGQIKKEMEGGIEGESEMRRLKGAGRRW